MNEGKNVQLLGVLGGMGPMAGAAFAARVVALTPAERDQDHIPLVLWNDPRVPDRSSARLGQGEDPLPAMLRGLRLLERSGADLVAIPCNTAHLWYDQLAAATRLPVLHIVESVCDDLERLGAGGGRVGLMGTAATLQLDLYGEPLRRQGRLPHVRPFGDRRADRRDRGAHAERGRRGDHREGRPAPGRAGPPAHLQFREAPPAGA